MLDMARELRAWVEEPNAVASVPDLSDLGAELRAANAPAILAREREQRWRETLQSYDAVLQRSWNSVGEMFQAIGLAEFGVAPASRLHHFYPLARFHQRGRRAIQGHAPGFSISVPAEHGVTLDLSCEYILNVFDDGTMLAMVGYVLSVCTSDPESNPIGKPELLWSDEVEMAVDSTAAEQAVVKLANDLIEHARDAVHKVVERHRASLSTPPTQEP